MAFLLLAIILGNNQNLFGSLLITVCYGFFSGWQRSMVYANGMGQSIFRNCLYSCFYWVELTMGAAVLEYFDRELAKKTLNFAKFFCLLSCLTTILGNITIPGATRMSSSFSDEEFPFYIYNMGAYSFIYAIAIFISIAIFMYRSSNNNKDKQSKTWLFLSFLIGTCVVFSQYLTAIAIACMSIFVFGKEESVWKIIVKLVTVFLIAYCSISVISRVLITLSVILSNNGMDSLANRIRGMGLLLGTNQRSGDVGSRIYLYSISLQHFLNNPLFGLIGQLGFRRASYHTTAQLLNMGTNSVMAVGQHSDFFDLLGGSGIVGTIPFILTVFSYFKKVFVESKSDGVKTLVVVVVIQYLLYCVFDHAFSCFDVSVIAFAMPAVVVSYRNFEKCADE